MALIDKASLLMVPSTYEDGTLYNVLPSGNKAPDETGNHNGYDQTRADFTFSRGSNLAATRVNSSGLIEKGRENLLLQSNSFDESDWGKYNVSVTTGQADKDGGTTAFKITKTGVNGRVYQAITQTGINTASVFVKAGDSTFLRFYAAGPNANVYFDLSDGTFHSGSAYISYDIESVGNGWYRCSVTFDGAATIRIYPAEDNTTGGASGSIFIQDSQAEAGLVATDYIETGATTATAGVLENTPRIDYSSGAGALLLEPQRTNLIPQSEYFGAWTLNGGGTGSNPILDFGYTSPEGVDNAYKVTFDTGAGTTTSDESIMYISKSGLTAGNDYTASVYLKGAVGGEEVIVRDTEGSYTKWTLTTEWKRYEMTQAAAGSSYATSFGVRQGLAGIGTINSNAIVYMYAFQSEAGSHVSSYVPTYGSAATRGADVCNSGGSAESINSTEGVAFVECSFLTDDAGENRDIYISDGTATNRIRIRLSSSDVVNFLVYNGSIQANMNYTLPNPTNNNKIAIKWKANDFALWVNGTERGTDTSGTTFSANTLDEVSFFTTYNQLQHFHSNVKQLAVFDEALSDSELATLTTL